jgi:transposase
VHTSFAGKDDGTVPSRYDPGTKAKALRLVREHAVDYPTEHTSITSGTLPIF